MEASLPLAQHLLAGQEIPDPLPRAMLKLTLRSRYLSSTSVTCRVRHDRYRVDDHGFTRNSASSVAFIPFLS